LSSFLPFSFLISYVFPSCTASHLPCPGSGFTLQRRFPSERP
jgi:hypothetical protein